MRRIAGMSKNGKMNRVVITGMGISHPMGLCIDAFTEAIRSGKPGITFHQNLKDLNFSCCIGGIPPEREDLKSKYLSSLQLRGFNSLGSCMESWQVLMPRKIAGITSLEEGDVDYESGIIFGAGTSGIDRIRDAIYLVFPGYRPG